MKTVLLKWLRLPLLILLLGLSFLPHASASFSSMYVFGDGVSATNEDVPDDPLFYGKRNCNGRVWPEVMCGWNGRTFSDPNRYSAFGNISEYVVTDTFTFNAPADVGTALFVIWCANADFVEYFNTEGTDWASFIGVSINRHLQAVANLYAKGARKFLMPNAVDIMATPFYNAYNTADKNFVTAKVIEFNAAFKTALENLASSPSYSGITIHRPDAFSFFEKVRQNPPAYGLINPFPFNSGVYDAPNASVNGSGSNYIFWDLYHPTAKFQMHLASFFQQQVMPVKVTGLSFAGGNGQLTVANIPLGRAGVIQGSATLQPGSWVQDNTINEASPGGSQTKTFTVPDIGPRRFYRVNFPVVWTWP